MDQKYALRSAPAIKRLLALGGLIASALLAAPAAAQQPAGIPILAYHRFDPTTAGPTTVTIAAFTAQLSWLAQHGVRVVRLSEAVAALKAPTLPRATAITVDDGHRSVYTYLFPLIRKRGIPVTLFIYPSAIGKADYALTWPQLREMQASGLVDVQSHTYWHPDFDTERRRHKPADFQRFVDSQLQQSKSVLEAHMGRPVDMLSWPYGIVAPDLERAAQKAGYRVAFAFAGGAAKPGEDLLALPRIPVSDGARGDRFGALVGLSPSVKRP